jgi:uncharacterized protein YigE (DUF2233 family)
MSGCVACAALLRGVLWSVVVAFALAATKGNADPITFGQSSYYTFIFRPHEIDLFWTDGAGIPLRQFARVQQVIEHQGKQVRFLMNAGIFEQGGIPTGLAIIEGREMRPINTAKGRGNFFLEPNGVFYIRGEEAFIVSTNEYVASRVMPRIAIQSGPLLLHHGKHHPAFRAESTNYLHRNGVGILRDGSVLFAITVFGQPRHPNLFEFADFFRSRGCADALFLDGDLSQFATNTKEAAAAGNSFGAIFAVSVPKD